MFRCTNTVALAGAIDAVQSNTTNAHYQQIREEFIVPFVALLHDAVAISEQHQRQSGDGHPPNNDGSGGGGSGGGNGATVAVVVGLVPDTVTMTVEVTKDPAVALALQ